MDLEIVIKSLDERTFTAYISVEVTDQQGDIVPVSVLNTALEKYMNRCGDLLLLHKAIPVGRIVKKVMTVHPKSGKPAIAIHGMIHNDGTGIFDKVWEQFVSPTFPVGFSIGGHPVRFHYNAREGKVAKIYDEIDLWEVSVICSLDKQKVEPANQFAHLIGLGHIPIAESSPMPIIVKMVMTNMPDDKKEEDKKKETSAPPKDTQEKEKGSEDLEKTVRDQVYKEAEKLTGGSVAMDLIKQKDATIAKLTTDLQILTRNNADLSTSLSRAAQDLKNKDVDILKARTAADTWREMYQKSVDNPEALSRLINSNIRVNDIGMPPNLGKVKIDDSVTKEELSNLQKYLRGETSVKGEDFKKMIAVAQRLPK